MNETEKTEALRALLKRAEADGADPAEFLLRHGVEHRPHAKWIRDVNYKGGNKDIFICSECLHWQSVRKMVADQVNYMNYCPFCGAKMDR